MPKPRRPYGEGGATADGTQDWAALQSHILGADGRMSACYPPFAPSELPHHLMLVDRRQAAAGAAGAAAASGEEEEGTREAFRRWRHVEHRRGGALVAGAWCRPLFVGGWQHSGLSDTHVYNLQTPTIFIDMRVAAARPDGQGSGGGGGRPSYAARGVASLGACSDADLRDLARQHCFAGYSLLKPERPWPHEPLAGSGLRRNAPVAVPVVTRHHAIDWNPSPRPTPNKWRVEVRDAALGGAGAPGGSAGRPAMWKEWTVAKDAFGQHLYMERWERLAGGEAAHGNETDAQDDAPFLALRRLPPSQCAGARARAVSPPRPDAFLVVCGSYFNYVQDRPTPLPSYEDPAAGPAPGTATLVDEALARGDRRTAEAMLDLHALHGRTTTAGAAAAAAAGAAEAGAVGGGCAPAWRVTKSLHPWREGETLLRPGDLVPLPLPLPLRAAAAAGSLPKQPPPFFSPSAPPPLHVKAMRWGEDEEWEVLECTFSEPELAQLLAGTWTCPPPPPPPQGEPDTGTVAPRSRI